MGNRLVAGLSLAVGLLVMACGPVPQRTGTPMLPSGFGALIPNAPLDAYVYLDQAEPFVFRSGEGAKTGTPALGLPDTLMVDSVALWTDVGGETPVVAVRIDMTDPRLIPALVQQISNASKGSTTPVWTLQQGDVLNVVMGSGSKASAYEQVMRGNDYVGLRDTHPRVWSSAQALPMDPPEPPIGIGYVNISDRVIDYLAKQGKPTAAEAATLDRLKPVLRQAGIAHAVFAAYGPSLPVLHPEVDLEVLWRQPYSGVVVFDSRLPAPVLDFLFHAAIGGADLERLTVSGLTTYVLPSRAGSVLVQNAGRTLVLAGGTDRKAAVGLLGTVDAAEQ